MQMDSYRYYTVVGANGAAVMSSWNRAQTMRQYIRRPSYKGFNDFQAACDWASAMLADRFPNAIFGAVPFKMNKFVSVRSLLNAADRFEEDI